MEPDRPPSQGHSLALLPSHQAPEESLRTSETLTGGLLCLDGAGDPFSSHRGPAPAWAIWEVDSWGLGSVADMAVVVPSWADLRLRRSWRGEGKSRFSMPPGPRRDAKPTAKPQGVRSCRQTGPQAYTSRLSPQGGDIDLRLFSPNPPFCASPAAWAACWAPGTGTAWPQPAVLWEQGGQNRGADPK